MFKQAKGFRYNKFFEALHQEILMDWYLEVGCRTGRVFSNARSKTIAIDPFFRIDGNVINAKPCLHIFQQTSDDFFGGIFLQAMKIRISFSFLDGMHLFEFLLRDFIAAEKFSAHGGLIALHDCCPYSHEMTTRNLGNIPAKAWTGDVWKLIPILKEYRPDLKITVLDAAPTGLVLIGNLDSNSRILENAYAEIVDSYTNIPLESFGLNRFNSLYDFTSTRGFIDAGYPFFDAIRQPESLLLKPTRLTP